MSSEFQQLSVMFTRRDGKGGELSNQASKIYIHRLVHIRNRSTNQIAGNFLFSSEITLIYLIGDRHPIVLVLYLLLVLFLPSRVTDKSYYEICSV